MAGSVIISEMSVLPPKFEITPRVHLFIKIQEEEEEETTFFLPFRYCNASGFVMRSHEEYFFVDRIHPNVSCKNVPLIYNVRLISPNMEMTVGPETCLDLLFQLGCLHVTRVTNAKLMNIPQPTPMIPPSLIYYMQDPPPPLLAPWRTLKPNCVFRKANQVIISEMDSTMRPAKRSHSHAEAPVQDRL